MNLKWGNYGSSLNTKFIVMYCSIHGVLCGADPPMFLFLIYGFDKVLLFHIVLRYPYSSFLEREKNINGQKIANSPTGSSKVTARSLSICCSNCHTGIL